MLKKPNTNQVLQGRRKGNSLGYREYLNVTLLDCALHLTELAKEMRNDN